MKQILLTMGLLLLTNVEADVIEKCLKENKTESCYEAGTLYSNSNRMKEAFPLYKKACEGGHADSCSNVGLMYAIGNGVEKNTQKAKEILSIACSKDAKSMACINLKYVNNRNQGSYIWMHGEKGTLTSDHQPVEVHAKACEKGSARDCIEAGFIYEVGDLAKKDIKKAIEFYNKGCDLNLSMGCSNMGILYVKNQNFTKSRECFKKACDKGDGRGCFGLASIYKDGLGVKQDIQKAKNLYKKACDKGDTESCQVLPYFEVNTEQDKKACKKGVGVACYNLGINYSLGNGVAKNIKESIKFYSQACDLNHYVGCIVLGYSYYTGIGVKKDINKSLKYYSKACNNGVVQGCSHLGIMYYYGYGVSIDKKKAKGLISKACNAGDTEACNNLNILKREEK